MSQEKEGHVNYLESLRAHADWKYEGEVMDIEDEYWMVQRPACSGPVFLLGSFRVQPERRRDQQMVVCVVDGGMR